MKKAEKLICDFVYEFVSTNWNKINKEKCEINNTKGEFLEDVKHNIQTAMWVITEVASWGMDMVYLRELYVELPEDSDFYVLKIGDKYIKYECFKDYSWNVNFTEPKTKIITYFE